MEPRPALDRECDGHGVVEETNGSNVVTLSRKPDVGFVRNGAQRCVQDELLRSVLAVRDQSDALTGQSEYDAYGNESTAGPLDYEPLGNDARWGYVTDRETGLC